MYEYVHRDIWTVMTHMLHVYVGLAQARHMYYCIWGSTGYIGYTPSTILQVYLQIV